MGLHKIQQRGFVQFYVSCLKKTFVGSKTVNLRAGLAAMMYNDGHQQLKKLFHLLEIGTGIHTIASFKKQDEERVQLSIKIAPDEEKRLGKP